MSCDEDRADQVKNKSLQTRYGISLEIYNNMRENQDYRCAICTRSESQFAYKLAVDHCHKTGQIRGLLCIDCNTGLGKFRDNKYVLLKAISYLEET